MNKKVNTDTSTIIAILMPIIVLSLNVISGIVLMAIIAIQLLILCFKLKKYNLKMEREIKNITTVIIVMLLITYLIDLLGGYFEYTISTTTLVFASIIVSFLILYYTKNKESTFEKIMQLFIIFVVFLCIYGLVIRVFGERPRAYIDSNGEKIYRQVLTIGPIHLYQKTMGNSAGNFSITSMTDNANTFSYLILYAFIMNLYFLKKYKEQKSVKNFYYFSFILFLVTICFAGSRMGIALVIVSYLAMKIFEIKRLKYMITMIVTLILLFLTFFSYVSLYNIDDIINIDLNGRDELWSIMPEVIQENIFIGKGLDSSRYIVMDKLGRDVTLFNSYFTMIANYGLILSILFYIIIIYIAYNNLKKYIKCRKDNLKVANIYLFTAIIIIIALMQGLVENNILRYLIYNFIYVFFISESKIISMGENIE